jgi:hypothetical protein
MIHKIAGLVVGLVVALVTMVLLEWGGNGLFNGGLPDDASAESAVAVVRQPTGLLLFTVAGWFFGALLGGATTIHIARAPALAWGLALVVLIGAAARFAMMPHPTWMIIAGVVAPIAGVLLALLLMRRRLAANGKEAHQ